MYKVIIRLVVAAVFFTAFQVRAEKGVNIYPKPRALPEHKISSQYGQKFKLSDFVGDFVVAVFWSRDCGPCIKELKSLNGFHKAVQGNGVQLVLISPDSEWSSTTQQKKFLRRYGAPDVQFYVDPGGKVASDLGIFTSPHTVLINKKGQEIGRIRGSAQWDDDEVIEYIYKLKASKG